MNLLQKILYLFPRLEVGKDFVLNDTGTEIVSWNAKGIPSKTSTSIEAFYNKKVDTNTKNKNINDVITALNNFWKSLDVNQKASMIQFKSSLHPLEQDTAAKKKTIIDLAQGITNLTTKQESLKQEVINKLSLI